MALPRRVKIKNKTKKKSASKSRSKKKRTSKSKKKKRSFFRNPWKMAGVLVATLAFVGSYFAFGGTVDKVINFFESIDPRNEEPKPTINEEPDLPLSDLKEFLPTQSLGNKIIRHKYYTVSYSTKHKNAEWVAYELTARRVTLDEARRRNNFRSDPGLDHGAKDSDYDASNYDRGHLAPAEDMNFSATAMEESFYLSNISPQAPDFNRGVWKKLENHIRTWASNNKSIYIMTGPILPKIISSNTKTIGDRVVVPTRFYKVVLDNTTPERKGIAFVLANQKSDGALSGFACSIRTVEEFTGINFFPKLSKEESDALEGTFDVTKWEMD